MATGFFVLILNIAYLASFATPNMFYVANVLYHIVFGLLLIPILFAEMGRIKHVLREIGGCGLLLGWPAYLLMVINALSGGGFGNKYMPETVGADCAFLDFSGDGLQDILLINHRDWAVQRRSTELR